MERGEEDMPDVYKLPPMEVKEFDDWQQDRDSEESGIAGIDIPEPDYLEDDHPEDFPNGSPGEDPVKYAACIYSLDAAGPEDLIGPKKLVNPVLESRERQELHRELMLNQKRGVDVLGRKSELKKAYERRTDVQKKKDLDEYQRGKRSLFEKKLEEQALKLDRVVEKKPKAEEPKQDSEFLKVFSKIQKNVRQSDTS